MSTADVSPDARPAAAPVPMPKDFELRRLASCISFLAVDVVERAKSGHPGMPMVRMGWDRYIGRKGGFVGMSDFGMSGKIAEVYERFGITTQAVVDAGRTAVHG